jgi:hypothetical protein
MKNEPVEFDVCAQLLEMKDVEIRSLQRRNQDLTNRSCRSCKHFQRRMDQTDQLINVCGLWETTGVYEPAQTFYCSHWENVHDQE